MRVVNGIYYTSIAVSIVFALASLFGVLGSVTVGSVGASYTAEN